MCVCDLISEKLRNCKDSGKLSSVSIFKWRCLFFFFNLYKLRWGKELGWITRWLLAAKTSGLAVAVVIFIMYNSVLLLVLILFSRPKLKINSHNDLEIYLNLQLLSTIHVRMFFINWIMNNLKTWSSLSH